jgi:hypothetical protein
MSVVLQQLPIVCTRLDDDIQSIKSSFDNQIKSITKDIENMSHASRKTHMTNFLSHELGTKIITPSTSATNGSPKPYTSILIDSYLGQSSPPSLLNGGSTLSTTRPSAHDLGPSDTLCWIVRNHTEPITRVVGIAQLDRTVRE